MADEVRRNAPSDFGERQTAILREQGMCGAIKPDGKHACIKPIDHDGIHGWEIPDAPEIDPWDDPRVTVIVDAWFEIEDRPDPSWPDTASKTLRALERAGWRIVPKEEVRDDR